MDLLKAKQEQLAADPKSADLDSDEELYRFFEDDGDKKKDKKKRRSSSGERKRRSSGEGGLRARVGRKVETPAVKVGSRRHK